MKSLVLVLSFIPMLISCQSEKTYVSKYPAQVGDIAFDEKLDDADFKRCLPDGSYAYQYYNGTSSGIQYKGEKLNIIRKLEKENIQASEDINGYITIRFLVNCEGKTGLFRVTVIDSDYRRMHHDSQLADKLLIFTKSLDGWLPIEIEGKKVDYYQYLTYKIKHGKVSEILP